MIFVVVTHLKPDQRYHLPVSLSWMFCPHLSVPARLPGRLPRQLPLNLNHDGYLGFVSPTAALVVFNRFIAEPASFLRGGRTSAGPSDRTSASPRWAAASLYRADC